LRVYTKDFIKVIGKGIKAVQNKFVNILQVVTTLKILLRFFADITNANS